jgi:hypothetical protein
MIAIAKVKASLVFMAAFVAAAELMNYSECAAQERRMFYVTINNYSGLEIGPGEVELWIEQPDGSERPADPSITEPILSGWEETYPIDVTIIRPGAHFRLVFRADCGNDLGKRIYFRSISFLYWPSQNGKRILIYPDSVFDRPGIKGNLARFEIRKNGGGPNSIDVSPGTLIELDYIFDGDEPKVEPKQGSHPDVVQLSSLGPRYIVVNGKRTGVASYFEVKRIGEDRISIVVDGVPRHFHLWSAY